MGLLALAHAQGDIESVVKLLDGWSLLNGLGAVYPLVQEQCCSQGDWNSLSFFEKASAADVKRCLLQGADPNARNEAGGTPLHWAAGQSKIPAVVKALLDAGADPNARNEAGGTPLHQAAGKSETPGVVKALLDGGADPNVQTESGKTALDLIPDDSPLRGTNVYWQLNDARF